MNNLKILKKMFSLHLAILSNEAALKLILCAAYTQRKSEAEAIKNVYFSY